MRHYRAGDNVEDLCRACKIDRGHTIIVVDHAGHPLRVQCDFCGSQHNYRGGASEHDSRPAPGERPRPSAAPLPPVSERERAAPPVHVSRPDNLDLELLLRRIIREETGLSPAIPAEKWRGGTMVLKPANPGLQEKQWPIDTLFHKIVMIRNRLRTLEQQVNGMDIPEDAKVKLQGYLTGCYGSLTNFNVLFADEADQFKGAAGD
ncbi:MAG: hypothetical protein Q7V01_04570 [Vicinamibacterales bacterium]|nr:hypothetical protein [Vicinamibacterales bacterium]